MQKNLFEISWEVCNKIGGIYTVISSKAPTIMKHFDHYYLIGSYGAAGNNSEFAKEEIPEKFKRAHDALLEKGIRIHFGRWLIRGYPKVILIEHVNYSSHINEIKEKLWELYKVDSLNSSWYDFDDVMLWSWCCGIAIRELSKILEDEVYVHSHEWMAGGAIFYLKSIEDGKKFNTVFTTHATMLGRAISGSGGNVYDEVGKVDAEKRAYEIGVHTKHQSEKALAKFSDCFTTVSNITSEEANAFYGKGAEVILYNGFDYHDRKSYSELQDDFSRSRADLNEFFKGYFHTTCKINLDDSCVIYTSGRNEFRNKGVDIFIKALGELNKKLRNEDRAKTVVSLFLIPVGEFEKDEHVLFSMNKYTSGGDYENKIKFAPLSTHNMPAENEIIRAFLDNGLYNGEMDSVKVILVPAYLNGNDGFLNKTYYDIICGTDLGVFPSFYEPWGYTPLESISYAVPTVTSDLAGFGRYVTRCCKDHPSIKVLSREEQDFEKSTNELYEFLSDFVFCDSCVSSQNREEAYKVSLNFDWEKFSENYLRAYDIARRKKE